MTDDRRELEQLQIDPRELEALREAFAQGSPDARPTPECPPIETIWAAAQRQLEPSGVRPVVAHMASCGFCAEAWRMAMRATPEAAPEAAAAATPKATPEAAAAAAPDAVPDAAPQGRPPRAIDTVVERAAWWQWSWQAAVPAGAFALLVLLVGLTFLTPAPEPVMRGASGNEIAALPGATELPREGFVLQWSPTADGSRYDIVVLYAAADEIVTVATAQGLTAPRHEVGAELLAAVPAGATIDWQVTATLPSGDQLTSPTFTTTLR